MTEIEIAKLKADLKESIARVEKLETELAKTSTSLKDANSASEETTKKNADELEKVNVKLLESMKGVTDEKKKALLLEKGFNRDHLKMVGELTKDLSLEDLAKEIENKQYSIFKQDGGSIFVEQAPAKEEKPAGPLSSAGYETFLKDTLNNFK